MAVTGQDKVFVVNADTNTKYGGVDPTGSFQTISDLKGYKVYTALITQSGGDEPKTITSGNLTKGVTYDIGTAGIDPPGHYDFSNVGGPVYPESFSFVATSNDVPNNYASQTLNYNTAAPVVTVLENTIGNIWWTYEGTGNYPCYSDWLFVYGKTALFSSVSSDPGNPDWITFLSGSPNQAVIAQFTVDGTPVDGISAAITIEIRVYN